jgi:bacillithiol synthase
MIIKAEKSKNSRFYRNKLYTDYVFDFQKLSDYFNHDYREIKSYIKRIDEIEESYDDNLRKGLVEILDDYNSGLGAGRKTLDNIRKLGESGTVIVVGGQQPGLFTGPLFIIYKIITILRLSSFINKETGIKTIPCFWNASDDSSIGQVDSVGLIGDELIKVKIDTSNIKKNSRFSNICIEKAKYSKIIEDIRSLFAETDFSGEVLSLLKESITDKYTYHGDDKLINLPELFSNIILKLFREYGIVLIDPSDERLKKMGNRFLNEDIEKHTSIQETVDSKGDELERAGYHKQLKTKQDTLNHFFNAGEIREKIECLPDMNYRVKDKTYSKKELIKISEDDPGLISWNVIMRPVIQDTIFPVLATVCGPGEVSYFAQISGVYELMDVKLPVIYPRFSATIIEKNIGKIIDRFKNIDKLLETDRELAIKRSLDDRGDVSVEGLVGGLEKKLENLLEDFEKEVSQASLRVGNSTDRIKRNIKKEIRVLKGKIYSELKKENLWLEDALNKFYLNLFPGGGLQEREVNFFYYANRYGIGILDGLYTSLNPFDFEHKLLFLK